jgi:nucleoid-associated protein YgaU
VTYFALLAAAALAYSPFGADAYPKRLHKVATEGPPRIGRLEQLVGSRTGLISAISAALLTIAFAAILVAYGPKLLSRGETEKASLEKPQPAPTQQATPTQPPAPKIVGNEPAKPSAETSPSAPADTYTIVAGDSLRSLAAKLYGDERQWRSIVTANPRLDPRRMQVGQVIKLPRSAPQQR